MAVLQYSPNLQDGVLLAFGTVLKIILLILYYFLSLFQFQIVSESGWSWWLHKILFIKKFLTVISILCALSVTHRVSSFGVTSSFDKLLKYCSNIWQFSFVILPYLLNVLQYCRVHNAPISSSVCSPSLILRVYPMFKMQKVTNC